MAMDVAVQDQERNVQAANDLLELMQVHQMEFVIRQHKGQQYIDVHIQGCDKLIGGSRGGLTTEGAERIYNCHVEILGELQSESQRQ
jgi:hypothetical protein